VVLLACGILAHFRPSARLNMAAGSLLSGIILFSGSLYLLAMKDFLGMPWLKVLGPITPLGGIMFIIGWIYLGIILKNTTIKNHK
jgi:uncharacterized membrane protein YgdD (TMEM256/DUF423 family)